MRAIIAAAGEGKRMLPLTLEKPKPMLEVLGKPLLAYIIESMPDEVDEILIVVGYKREVIENYFGESYDGKKINYIVQEKKTGTGDAIFLCRPYLKEGERFLLSWADDIYDKESITRCLSHRYCFLLAEASDPRRYGVILVNEDGSIKEIEEKPEHPKSKLIAPGIYILDTDIYDYSPEVIHGENHLTPMLSGFARDHKVYTEKTDFWVTIGFPEDLKVAEGKIRERNEKNSHI